MALVVPFLLAAKFRGQSGRKPPGPSTVGAQSPELADGTPRFRQKCEPLSALPAYLHHMDMHGGEAAHSCGKRRVPIR